MGYYVTLTGADFRIPELKWTPAFESCVALNKRDDLKTGGSWGPDGQTEKWFAWMPKDYPADAVQAWKDGDVSHPLVFVFKQLGFEVAVLEGYLHLEQYDNKTGAEDYFLEAVAPFVTPGSWIEWRGEDGEVWRQEFDGQYMKVKQGRVVFK